MCGIKKEAIWDEWENYYYLRGSSGELIRLPYHWTISDCYKLRAFLFREYHERTEILYGSAATGYDVIYRKQRGI